MSSHNPNTVMAGTETLPMIQDYLNNMLVSMKIATSELRSYLRSGERVDLPYVPDLYVQDYIVGTDMTFPGQVAVSDVMTIDQSRAANFTLDKNQLTQMKDKSYQAKLSKQAAYRLSADMDQKLLQHCINSANNTVAGGTLNYSNIFGVLSDTLATLQRSNAEGVKFCVMDPERVSLLAQTEVANGWQIADSALKNGFVGESMSGFKIFRSNNLPTSVVYTMDTINTAGRTFTICGVTFTFVASGTAAAAGEISIGANVAANQANFRAAINGTGSPGASTYIELSVESRNNLRNAGVSASAFSSDDTTITGFGKLNASTTSADGGNGVGTETGSLLAGDIGAIDFVAQRMPELDIGTPPLRPQESNLSYSTLWGRHVRYRNRKRLVNLTINV